MSNCENCGGCAGGCDGCSGCARELVVSPGEMEFLKKLGQFAFLPVARKMGDLAPCYPEPDAPENVSLILQLLEKKNLISIDYKLPLKGCGEAWYLKSPVQGSLALTARGQRVLDLLDYQGIL